MTDPFLSLLIGLRYLGYLICVFRCLSTHSHPHPHWILNHLLNDFVIRCDWGGIELVRPLSTHHAVGPNQQSRIGININTNCNLGRSGWAVEPRESDRWLPSHSIRREGRKFWRERNRKREIEFLEIWLFMAQPQLFRSCWLVSRQNPAFSLVAFSSFCLCCLLFLFGFIKSFPLRC